VASCCDNGNVTRSSLKVGELASQGGLCSLEIYRMGQKSLTNFTIILKIINCQEKCETNFICWIHAQSFFYTLSSLHCGHPVSHLEHPV
jgi:hypothetical protein